MNFSRSYTDWGEDSRIDAEQIFTQVQDAIAKSRKIVEGSVAQTRKNNERIDLQQTPIPLLSPTKQQLQSQHSLTQERESAIFNLKSRIQQLETAHRALARSPQATAGLNLQLKAAISQRDQYEREAASLRTVLNDLEAKETHRRTKQTQSLLHELEQELRENEELTQLVAAAKSHSQINAFSTEKVRKLEEKLTDLENAHMSQVQFNSDLARKLETWQSDTESILRQVSELVSEQDLNLDTVQHRLQDSEEQCERLRDWICSTEDSGRPRSEVCGKSGTGGKGVLRLRGGEKKKVRNRMGRK